MVFGRCMICLYGRLLGGLWAWHPPLSSVCPRWLCWGHLRVLIGAVSLCSSYILAYLISLGASRGTLLSIQLVFLLASISSRIDHAFPLFTWWMAFSISTLLGFSQFFWSTSSAGAMSGGFWGGGRFSSSSICSFHLFNWSSSLVSTLPFLSLMGLCMCLYFPANCLVIAYRFFMFPWADASSASLARSSMKFSLHFVDTEEHLILINWKRKETNSTHREIKKDLCYQRATMSK